MRKTKTSKSTLEMSHQEWLEDHKRGIGGSDVTTVLGLNRYKSPYQLQLEKTGQIELKDLGSEPAYWGNVLEEMVAKEFQERTGKKVRRRNQVFKHPLHPFLKVNIDREVMGENAILECKTANQFLGREWEGEEVLLSYLYRIQHYVNVLNKGYCYATVLIGGQKSIQERIARDQGLIDTVTERLVEFWETNVVEGIEPVINGSEMTAGFLKEKYTDVEENQTALPSCFNEFIKQKREFKRTKKETELAIRQVNNEIISELGKCETSIDIIQKNIISWKLVRTRRMNSKKLAEKYPDVADDEETYNVTKSRRLTEKKIK